MRTLIFLLACWMGTIGAGVAEEVPYATGKPLASPQGTFTVSQFRGPAPDGNFKTRIHFTKDRHPDLFLEAEWVWPALFYVSPDDRWILQIQKVGSGDNVSYLHHLDAQGHLHTERRLNERAFKHLEGVLQVPESDLYHTGAEFQGWDMKSGLLKFTLSGSFVDKKGRLHQDLFYDLKNDRFRTPGKTAPSPSH